MYTGGMNAEVLQRSLAPRLVEAAGRYPIVSVTGPRQSGKTTLVRHCFPEYRYVSLEAPDEREFALADPRGFMERFKEPVILDEVQQVPELFSYLQVYADEAGEPGRYIISGSQNFLLMRSISQSLAGRCYVAHLLPFTMAELQGMHSATIAITPPAATAAQSLAGQWTQFAHCGFYPPIHHRGLVAGEWLSQYFQTYLQRDLRDLAHVGDLEAFRRFVLLCAGRAGQLLNFSALANDCGISHQTARRWLSLLETSFIIFRLPPHHRNFGKRLTKSPKLYFHDTGLLCYLLRISAPEQLEHHAMRGPVFENLIIAELVKHTHHAGREPALSFWRDHRGNEVDLVVEDAGQTAAIEIKSGATASADHFRGLKHWRQITGTGGQLIYGGNESCKRGGHHLRSWRNWPLW